MNKLTKTVCDIAKVCDDGQNDPECVLLLLTKVEKLHGAAHAPPVLQRRGHLSLLLQIKIVMVLFNFYY